MPDGGAEALGDELFVQVPPQGGHVAYVGAKVTNFEGCRLELRASLYPPDSGSLAAEEKRRVDLTVDGASDPSDPANFANVPVCPNYGTRDFPGLPWVLVVEAKQRDGRSVSVTRTVVPSCAYGAAHCATASARGLRAGQLRGPRWGLTRDRSG
ncbi:MAG: hypothetical protein IPJ65_26875 [Archangiaceae bacterium]|nr:hypothetical protein [Archangiaceae bacterium]